MSSIVCKICSQEVKEDNLKHWWVDHGIKMADYFIKYYDKRSLLNGDPIKFKSIDQYLLSDFNGKKELNLWLKSQTKDKQKEYLKETLLRRKNTKSLTYIPTQVEQRSAEGMVGIKYYNDLFGNYYELCQNLGFKSRGFVNINNKTILKKERDLRGNAILVDSREQKMANWGNKEINICTLPYADYSLKNDNYGIYFERKELGDFINSHSQGFTRLKNEIKRAQLNNDYIIMMVESSLNDAMSFEYLPHISKKIQASSSFIMHRCRELIQEFSNYQVCFCNGRIDLVKKMRFIMELGKQARNYDYQLLFDLKLDNENI